MKRAHILIASLVTVLLVALFFVVLFQPLREDLAAVEADIEQERGLQVTAQREIDRLESVRNAAPEAAAEVATADTIVPQDPAMPAALRQLQFAADDAQLSLDSVTTTRPEAVPESAEGLARIGVTAQITGSYFQLVDFLRRIEDPRITSRGISWTGVTISRAEYPDLNVSLTGEAFTVQPSPAPEPPAEEPAEEDEDGVEFDPEDDPSEDEDDEVAP